MYRILLFLLICTATCLADTVPPGGELLVGPDHAWKVGQHKKGASELVPDERFRQAIRFTVENRGQPWDVGLGTSINRAFKKGDALLLRVWVRTIRTRHESGQGLIHFNVQALKPTWSPVLGRDVTAGEQWQEFFIPGVCPKDYEPGQLALGISAAYVPQVIEVAGIELYSYGQMDVSTLPNTRTTYAGREPGAAWRVEAEKRIEEMRKAPLKIQVIDRAGKPVAGAEVKVELVKHDFKFGLAVDHMVLIADRKLRAKVTRENFTKYFNAGSFTNAHKWQAWLGEWGPDFAHENVVQALRWMRDHDINFRGHVLIWPSWPNMPKFVRPLKSDPPALQRLALSHIDEMIGAAGNLVQEWDVLNEPRDNHDLMDLCGEQVMAEWFHRARQRAPHATLVLNDYAIITGLSDSVTQDQFEKIAKTIIDAGAPLDGLGFQGHFGATVPPPERVLKVLDRFARLGKTIRITEYTIAGKDADLHRDFTRDVWTALFSHPSVVGIQIWGEEAVFNPDGSLTPIGQAVAELRSRWHTSETGRTSAEGEWEVRGFLGRYRVTVKRGDVERPFYFHLRKDGPPLVVTVEQPSPL